MKYQIEPAGHRVLIKVIKPEEKTRSGIYIAATMQDKLEASSEIGIVTAIGSTAFDAFDPHNRWGIKVGDKVLFVKQGGKVVPQFDLTEKSEDMYRIVNDEDIVGIVRENN